MADAGQNFSDAYGTIEGTQGDYNDGDHDLVDPDMDARAFDASYRPANAMLAPARFNPTDAVNFTRRNLDPQTNTASKTVFRIPKTSIVDLDRSALCINVSALSASHDSAPTGPHIGSNIKSLPMYGGIMVLFDRVEITAGGSIIVQTPGIDLLRSFSYGRLPYVMQKKRGREDGSFTRFSPDVHPGTPWSQRDPKTFFENEFLDECLSANLVHDPKTLSASGTETSRPIYDSSYDIHSDQDENIDTFRIKVTELAPGLLNVLRRLPAAATGEIIITIFWKDLVKGTVPLFAPGLTWTRRAIDSDNEVSKRYMPVAIDYTTLHDYVALPGNGYKWGVKVNEIYIDMLQVNYPASIIGAVADQINAGRRTDMYSRITYNEEHIAVSDRGLLKTLHIHLDRTTMKQVTFAQQPNINQNEALVTRCRFAPFITLPCFQSLQVYNNSVQIYQQPLEQDLEFMNTTSKVLGGYEFPAMTSVYRLLNIQKDVNKYQQGIMIPQAIQFLLPKSVSNSPLRLLVIPFDVTTITDMFTNEKMQPKIRMWVEEESAAVVITNSGMRIVNAI